MTISITFVLLVLAAVCFLIACLPNTLPRVNWIALGLLLWVLTELIGGIVIGHPVTR